jgi:isopenicillin N synthase-like dioxygenase
MRHVPIVDLSPFLAGSPADKKRVAASVGAACEQIGFLTIVGHGVSPELTLSIYRAAHQFFDLPDMEKRKLPMNSAGAGYSPLQGETLAAGLGQAAPADLKESLNIGADFAQNLWPATPTDLKPAALAYFGAMAALAASLMRLFALALDLPEHFFDDKIDRHRSFLRLINYPDQESDPLPGQLRAGEHTDYGTLTILRSENAPGGLEVRNRDGEWVVVESAPDSFIVNIGDLMMYWTNDRWISTLHRVVNPPRDKRLGSRCQSLVFFHNPNPDAVITCLDSCHGPGNPAKYPPITAGEHLPMKVNKAYRKGAL